MQFDDNILRCTPLFVRSTLPTILAAIFYFALVLIFPILSKIPYHHPATWKTNVFAVAAIIMQGAFTLGVLIVVRNLLVTYLMPVFNNDCLFDAAARTFQIGKGETLPLDADTKLRVKADWVIFAPRYVVWVDSRHLQGRRALRPAIGVFFNATDAERAIQEIANFTGLQVVDERIAH